MTLANPKNCFASAEAREMDSSNFSPTPRLGCRSSLAMALHPPQGVRHIV